MESWQLQEAKSKFSHLVDLAMQGDTQVVTKRGIEAVAIISIAELNALKKFKHETGLVDALMAAPKFDEELDLTRLDEDIRDIEF